MFVLVGCCPSTQHMSFQCVCVCARVRLKSQRATKLGFVKVQQSEESSVSSFLSVAAGNSSVSWASPLCLAGPTGGCTLERLRCGPQWQGLQKSIVKGLALCRLLCGACFYKHGEKQSGRVPCGHDQPYYLFDCKPEKGVV